MKRIKPWFLVLFAIFIAVLIVICSIFLIEFHNTKKTEEEEEKQSLVIFNSWGEEEEKNILLNNIIDEYVQNKNIEINNISLSYEEFYKKLNMDLITSNSPDIIITKPDKRIKDLFVDGKICSLNEELEKDSTWSGLFDKSFLKFLNYNDNIYGIPMTAEYYTLFYNKEIFRKAGLRVPKNLEELRNVAEVLGKNGKIPIAYSSYDDCFFQAVLASVAGSAEMEKGISNDNLQDFYRAMDIMKYLYSNNAFPKNFADLTKKEAIGLFIKGDAAMYVGSADSVLYEEKNGALESGNGEQYDVAFFPDLDGDSIKSFPIAYGVGDFVIFVSSKALEDKHDVVIDFIKYLSSEKTALLFYSNLKAISTIKNTEILTKKGELETNYRMLVTKGVEFVPMPNSKIDGYVWQRKIIGMLPNVMNGSITPDMVCDEAIKMQSGAEVR